MRKEARGWSEEEERLFQEALDLHGRDWGACAKHIGTRDAKSVTSHAQKYMIRLCMDGKLLPQKMAESGAGYTLSGKLLDPASASAIAYGLKPTITASAPLTLLLSCSECSLQIVYTANTVAAINHS